jgi:secreted trypsin-like serine protease
MSKNVGRWKHSDPHINLFRFLANLVAVFGEFDISGELESRRSVTKNVRRVIVHRQYDPATFANDLALLELESPVEFDEHVVPICMPHDKEDFTGRMATVTGWGRLKYGAHDSTKLQWLNRFTN